jgi:hypothetical protein
MDQEKVIVEKKFCQYCKQYDRKTKKCPIINNFTKRKSTCVSWAKK